MPICKKCETEFSNRMIIDGKNRNLNKRNFCLTCSPFKGGNNQDLTNLRRTDTHKTCPQCKETKILDDFYKRRDGTDVSPYCKPCTLEQARIRQRLVKQKAVEYKGGKCETCGFDKHLAALQFHHRDPSKKDFHLAKCRKTNFDKHITDELDKCMLVCANCHAEIHAKF